MKPFKILLGALISVVVTFTVFSVYVFLIDPNSTSENKVVKETKKETLEKDNDEKKINKQLQEIEVEKGDWKASSEEEISKQLQELEELKK